MTDEKLVCVEAMRTTVCTIDDDIFICQTEFSGKEVCVSIPKIFAKALIDAIQTDIEE